MESGIESSYDASNLAALPNELLFQILTPSSTLDLLPLTSVCRRLHDIVVRIITYRVALASGLNGNTLLLECYPPSQRLTEPHLSCTHLSNHGLDDALLAQEGGAAFPPGYLLKQLRNAYSVFQLHRKARKKIPMKHPAGDIPGSRTYTSRTSELSTDTASTNQPADPSAAQGPDNRVATATSASFTRFGSIYEAAQTQALKESSNTQLVYEPVIQHAHMDQGVLFSQFCCSSTIAIAAPYSETFIGFQNIIPRGILRVRRPWLNEHAAKQAPPTAPNDEPTSTINVSGAEEEQEVIIDPDVQAQAPLSSAKSKAPQSPQEYDPRTDKGILWVDHGSSVGIRFSVRELKWRQRAPVLMSVDDDPPASYELRYDELIVRTSDLLLASERAESRQRVDTGKSILIGKFYTTNPPAGLVAGSQ